MYKGGTVRRRAEEFAYDPDCADYLNIPYDDYMLKGANTFPAVSFPHMIWPEWPVPMHGRDFISRRVYTYESFGLREVRLHRGLQRLHLGLKSAGTKEATQ